ncbi:unnamed protein product, partial [Symbiodinium pilosum]
VHPDAMHVKRVALRITFTGSHCQRSMVLCHEQVVAALRSCADTTPRRSYACQPGSSIGPAVLVFNELGLQDGGFVHGGDQQSHGYAVSHIIVQHAGGQSAVSWISHGHEGDARQAVLMMTN